MPSDSVYGLTGLAFVLIVIIIAVVIVSHVYRKRTPKPQVTAQVPSSPKQPSPILSRKLPRCDYCNCLNKAEAVKCEFCGAPLEGK